MGRGEGGGVGGTHNKKLHVRRRAIIYQPGPPSLCCLISSPCLSFHCHVVSFLSLPHIPSSRSLALRISPVHHPLLLHLHFDSFPIAPHSTLLCLFNPNTYSGLKKKKRLTCLFGVANVYRDLSTTTVAIRTGTENAM